MQTLVMILITVPKYVIKGITVQKAMCKGSKCYANKAHIRMKLNRKNVENVRKGIYVQE